MVVHVKIEKKAIKFITVTTDRNHVSHSFRGVDFIAQERKRQIEVLGYSREGDLDYADELVSFASQRLQTVFDTLMVDGKDPEEALPQLIKAGALIAAAIDSIQMEKDQ